MWVCDIVKLVYNSNLKWQLHLSQARDSSEVKNGCLSFISTPCWCHEITSMLSGAPGVIVTDYIHVCGIPKRLKMSLCIVCSCIPVYSKPMHVHVQYAYVHYVHVHVQYYVDACDKLQICTYPIHIHAQHAHIQHAHIHEHYNLYMHVTTSKCDMYNMCTIFLSTCDSLDHTHSLHCQPATTNWHMQI